MSFYLRSVQLRSVQLRHLAATLALTAPFAVAQAQVQAATQAAADSRMGVSHPDDTIISATQDDASSRYVPYVPPAKPSAATPLLATANATETTLAKRPTPQPVAPVDIDAGIVTRIPGPANQLPEGTLLKIRMHQSLSTLATRAGTRFDGELAEAIDRDGHVLLPPGTLLTGRVTQSHGGHRISGGAVIHLLPLSLTLPDGTHYTINAQVIDTNQFHTTKVDSEGTISRRSHTGQTAAIFGLSAGGGATAGALIAGPAGAVVGAGIGAGVATVVWLKQDRQATLPSETIVTFALNDALTVNAK